MALRADTDIVNVPLLDLVAQYRAIKDDVLPAVQAVIESQQFVMGPSIPRLETAIAGLGHAKHGIACASGTDALLLPLKALDLKPGDEVITTPFTFFATAGTIHNAGGTPVFVDIEPGTFNIDPAAVEAAITPRTRAVMPVHLYGQMAAMERLLPLAGARGLRVIEDAAQAIGARRRIDGGWRMAGERGWVTGYSFFPSKNLGAWGDGGMMVTSDDALAERLRKLRLHGGAKQYHHDEVGTNSRLDSLQAAVLLAKLPHLASWSSRRRDHAAYYDQGLSDVPGVRVPAVDPANEHIYHQYTVRVERRDELQAHLKAKGIGSAVYYPVPLHLQNCFAHLGYQPGRLPQAERACREVLSLPVFPELTRQQLDYVIETIRGFYR
ncbi:MAG TPA: DegT/DnrJ/EryC1/StrS family aminotransferase [Gemmatimonadales bacterium]|nr:DegT/DnrJ/EryC1/StrS family aminotransferase [Gemmatimonadales bacterium]